jgi:Glyoxalase/Bleomycin resistance protein/Dioxygenase superfamily
MNPPLDPSASCATAAPLRPADLYHVAIVVDDVEAAMQQWSALAGYRWMQPVEAPVPVWTAAGETVVTLQMVYSIDEPRLELIREVPGTTWVRSGPNAIHHVGYFVDDVGVASAVLADRGVPLEACGCAHGARPSGFAYHLGADGVRVEVIHRSALRDMETLMDPEATR